MNHAVLTPPPSRVPWGALPRATQIYVMLTIAAGAIALLFSLPRTLPDPAKFTALLLFACVTSMWKVSLPITIANGSTLSVSYAANLMTLLLLGPQQAVLIAMAGVWTQCRYHQKQPYPAYRTIFSIAAVAITMAATGAIFIALGGSILPHATFPAAKPLVGAIGVYFLVNTGLIAGAIALSSQRAFLETWGRDFLWSGASFIVAGTAGVAAAIVVQRGDHWMAVLLVAPIYLTYRSYELFAARLEDQKRHTEEIRGLHTETVAALDQARAAEHALAEEKERLAVALAEMTRLEASRVELLAAEQAARAAAEAANRTKDQFLAIVSHELRTPLNAILGWSEMLARKRLDGKLHDRAVLGISESARRQAHLVEDLLDVARIAAGKIRLDREFVELNDVVRDALLVAQPSAAGKRIRLTSEAPPWNVRIFGDRVRLQQIASNLISNAVKFTPEDGQVTVRLRRAGGWVELIVTDSGQGIPAEFVPHVFELFRQADASTTRMHSGLGLGLSIVKSLVEAHDGTVTVDSAGEGLGATFTVRLPAAAWERVPARPSADRMAPPADEVPLLEGIRVLVVDDDEESREVVAAHLQGSHADVLTAASAADAFDLLQHEHVDVLLADIGMPGEDGYSLMRRIRALHPAAPASIPAAALTAFARDDDRVLAQQAGFQLHLSKPVDAAALIAAVATLNTMTAG